LAPVPLVAIAIAASACASRGPHGPAASKFDGNRALDHIRQLVAIGPRVPGSPGAAVARTYITRQLTASGLAVREQAFVAQTPLGPVRMVNLSATVPAASTGARGRLIVAGHYDTKLFDDFSFVGANDGGSSTAFLIELGRVLVHRRNALAIELLFLDGEEALVAWEGDDHTYGSRHYVEAATADGSLADIRAMILVDMIGDRDLRIKREVNSTDWLTELLWSGARRAGRAEFVDGEVSIEDDHTRFLEAGVPAVNLIDLDYPAWHTAGDTLDKVAATSLQAVADALMAALPDIERRLAP
jgi:hypothetical protein